MDTKTLKTIIYRNLETTRIYEEEPKLYQIKLIDANNEVYVPEHTRADKYGIRYFNEYTLEPPYLIVETFDIIENLKHTFGTSPELIEF